MPTWGEILKELNKSKAPEGTGRPDFDGIRRKYLSALNQLTGRPVILYAAAFLEPRSIPPADLQIGLGDVMGFMEACSNINERQLDLILHSPGGSAEAAESVVEYLRQRFDHVRVIVPVAAMSAATMLALSADEIVMGQHSQLGPTYPQFIVVTPEGPRSAPAKAILNQFERAKEQCKDLGNLPAWLPILRSYLPGLLTQCEDSRALAVKMVSSWLKRYMFKADSDAEQKAEQIANWFADYEAFQSHGRRVGPEQAIQKAVKVTRLESDGKLQDAVLSVHHATMHTFSGTPAAKIIENHNGRAWIRISGQVVMQIAPGGPPAGGTPSVPLGPGGRPLSRAERRGLQREGR